MSLKGIFDTEEQKNSLLTLKKTYRRIANENS